MYYAWLEDRNDYDASEQTCRYSFSRDAYIENVKDFLNIKPIKTVKAL